MTKVTLERTGSQYTGYWYTIEAVGHATGSASVCTAVSTMVQVLQTWLVWTNAATYEEDVGKGNSRIRFAGKGCGTAFDMMYCGFRRLAESYPSYITLETKLQ